MLHFENNTWTNRNLTELIISILNNITIPCNCPAPICCGCEGKVTSLVLRYTGLVNASITVKQKKPPGPDVIIFGPTNIIPGGLFAVNGVDAKGTLSTEITLFVDGNEDTRIHTSCSDPVGPGLIAGSFEVISGESREFEGPLCPVCQPATTTTTAAAEGQVEICHDFEMIVVDEADVPSHLAHGDTMECPTKRDTGNKRKDEAPANAWHW